MKSTSIFRSSSNQSFLDEGRSPAFEIIALILIFLSNLTVLLGLILFKDSDKSPLEISLSDLGGYHYFNIQLHWVLISLTEPNKRPGRELVRRNTFLYLTNKLISDVVVSVIIAPLIIYQEYHGSIPSLILLTQIMGCCNVIIFWMLVKCMLVKSLLYVGENTNIQFHTYSPTSCALHVGAASWWN